MSLINKTGFLAGPVTATLKVVEPMSLLMGEQSKASNYSLEQW